MKTKIYSFMKKAILVLLILVVSSGLAFAENGLYHRDKPL